MEGQKDGSKGDSLTITRQSDMFSTSASPMRPLEQWQQ